jgi:DNA-binding transcriptional MerR regulator
MSPVPDDRMRLDDLARAAGVATTTVRLYQSKGLLPGPELVGRTGYYDKHHLTRLALIARLQEQGFSLAGIGRLLDTWEHGRDLADLVGVEEQLDSLLDGRRGIVLDVGELLETFPADTVSPDVVRRAAALGLVEPMPDGRVRVPDQRFLETGSALMRLGVPAGVVLDEWEHLARVTDRIAKRFIAVFEDHLLPDGWRDQLDADAAAALASTLGQLQRTAAQVVAAALDASIAREGAKRLGSLVPEPATPAPARSRPAPRRRRASVGRGSGT